MANASAADGGKAAAGGRRGMALAILAIGIVGLSSVRSIAGNWAALGDALRLCYGVDVAGSALLAGVGLWGLVKGLGRVPALLASGTLLALGATLITGVLTGVIPCSGPD